MGEELKCYRCGASLAALTLPLSQRDECPACEHYLHVCRMCVNYDPQVVKKCREDDAEEVIEKEKLNFCEWFKPSADAHDPAIGNAAKKASSQLAALFGGVSDSGNDDDDTLRAAKDLFR